MECKLNKWNVALGHDAGESTCTFSSEQTLNQTLDSQVYVYICCSTYICFGSKSRHTKTIIISRNIVKHFEFIFDLTVHNLSYSASPSFHGSGIHACSGFTNKSFQHLLVRPLPFGLQFNAAFEYLQSPIRDKCSTQFFRYSAAY